MATNFKLWLDTAAPAKGAMSLASNVGKVNSITLNHTISDPSGPAGQNYYMKVWASTSKTATASEAASINWEAFSSPKVVSIPQASNVSTRYYVHTMYMDSVRNVSSVYTEDTGYLYVTKLPEISNKSFPTKVTGDESLTFSFNATQYATGFAEIKVTGPKGTIKTATSSPVSFTGVGKTYLNVGTNTLTITVTDTAGNTKTDTVTVIYDSQVTTGTFYFGKSASDATAITYSNSSADNVYLYVSTTSTDFASITYEVKCGTTAIVTQATKSSGLTPSSGHIYIGAFPTSGKIDGTWVASGTYVDTAGETGSLTSGQVIRDATRPVIVKQSAPVGWYTNVAGSALYPNTAFTFKITETGSGIDTPLNWDIDNDGDIGGKDNYTVTGPTSSVYSLLPTNYSGASSIAQPHLGVYDKASNRSNGAALPAVYTDSVAPTVTVNLSSAAVDVTGKGKCLASTTTPIQQFTVIDPDPTDYVGIPGSGVQSVQIKWSQSGSTPTSWDTVTGISGSYVTAVNDLWSSTNADGTWYLHYKATDNVSNVTTNKISFLYDKTAPTGSVTGPSTTTTKQNTLTLSASDGSGSGVTKMMVTSNTITDSDSTWVNFTTSRTITFKDTELSGDKVISVQFKDAVGNVSATYTCTIEYTSDRSPVVTILTTSDVDAGNYTKVLPFKIRISDSIGDVSVYSKYKIYGNFSKTDESTAETSEPSGWTTFTPDSGKNYMTVSGLYFSKNDGVKSVKLKVQNKAGSVYPEVVDTITLDRTPPNITLTNVSSNIISNIHETRQGTTLTGEGAYANTVTFQFSCDEYLAAYKVCVVDTSATDSQAASEAAIAIGETNGSVNMSGADVNENTVVYCTLRGADLMAHPLVASTDGAYIVGVYGKDRAGMWSLIGTIAT